MFAALQRSETEVIVKAYEHLKLVCFIFKDFLSLVLEDLTSPRHIYYESKCFPHFDRIRNWTKNCRTQLKEVSSSLGQGATLTSDIMIKISCVGEVTEENLKQIGKQKGEI